MGITWRYKDESWGEQGSTGDELLGERGPDMSVTHPPILLPRNIGNRHEEYNGWVSDRHIRTVQ